MSDNVGLSTPRGSGTSGYVQRNLAHMRPRDIAAPYAPRDTDSLRHKPRQPDQGLLEHDRKREVEVKVFELRDQLEEQEVNEEEIDSRCDALRKKLLAELDSINRRGGGPRRNLKAHQVHELADAKIKESERLRQALKISRDYEEGSHWRKQEERLRKAMEREGGGGEAQEKGKERERERERERDRDRRERSRERYSGRDEDRYSERKREDGRYAGRDETGGARDRSGSASVSRSRSRSRSPRRDRARDSDRD